MDLWTTLLDILILLAAAMVLGGLCERLRQSPILGYLLAGTLLGPNAFDLLPSHAAVSALADLGVALLLFTIGLEFSWRKLRAVGPVALGGGSIQVLVTGALTAAVCLALGLEVHLAITFGAMVAVSSTAAVIRLLAKRAEIDAVHGRNAVGILLLQDIAVVPLVMIVTALGGGASTAEFGLSMVRALGLAALLVVALHVVLNYGVPVILSARVTARNRDLPILLAIATAIGAAWLSHSFGFSPMLGAFIAGMVLAESRFSTQIRADVVPFQTLFVTLFFSSIGMLSNPGWVAEHWPVLLLVVAAVVIGKTVITALVVRMFDYSWGQSLATGVTLAQVGEFSLVIATVALAGAVIGQGTFELIVASLILTLFLTPYLAALAPRLATVVGRRSAEAALPGETAGPDHDIRDETAGHVIILGFGPAGQRVAERLMRNPGLPMLVGELNSGTAAHAEAYALPVVLGDVTREEVLERLHVRTAAAVVVTVPDPATARQIVQRVRALSPDTAIVVRSRYHVHRWQLDVAGAHAVIDEEDEVGFRLASEVRKLVRQPGARDHSDSHSLRD
jgi:CPA2 family monovalent cation:H+ antiporter-2